MCSMTGPLEVPLRIKGVLVRHRILPERPEVLQLRSVFGHGYGTLLGCVLIGLLPFPRPIPLVLGVVVAVIVSILDIKGEAILSFIIGLNSIRILFRNIVPIVVVSLSEQLGGAPVLFGGW